MRPLKTSEGGCGDVSESQRVESQGQDEPGGSTLNPFLTSCQKLWLGGRKLFGGSCTPAPVLQSTPTPIAPRSPVLSPVPPLPARIKDPALAIQNKYQGMQSGTKEETPHLLVHSRADFVHYLIPNQRDILNCPFYWGKIDRYQAEALVANQPEGSFLLRDSAQDDFVFSVSFRRYNRTLHARIEEESHRYSFDRHDPGIHSSPTVIELLNFYQDPMCCMFFEPLLVRGVSRTNTFSLQSICRAVVCDNLQKYDDINKLPIPRTLTDYLREYHYKHKIRTRNYDRNGAGSSVTAEQKSNPARMRKGIQMR